ncbi:hypothetical protein [Cronobacter sakazakii]|uniref:hypothetical protein n=1 Tax=Cronobacter sakazakii TaxID=28141 RepID=UPI001ED9420B|nr:hypothetical protein [Cronobacter sakazakii]
MSIQNFHAVERVVDVRPEYALPLGARSRSRSRRAAAIPDVLNPAYIRDVLSNPDAYRPEIVEWVRADAVTRGEKVTHAFNPDEAVYIVARSATSDTRTSGVSRGLSPELPPKMAERMRERERHERNRARPRKAITEAVRADIIDRAAKGQSNRYIAEKVGVSKSSVNTVLNMARMSVH